jgi:23S rRNA pseudouridine1911/1915/1917 synthase
LISIIYQDNDILLLNKPAGIDSQNTQLISGLIPEFAGKELLPVHRLDQRVSGLILFALNKESLAILNDSFQNRAVQKHYRAMVNVCPEKQQDTLTHWILKDSVKQKAKAFTTAIKNSKKAILQYTLVKSSEKYHLLEIELYTGRFHQIRAQLAAIGSPIVGDVKYGYKRTIPGGSIFLQSYYLSFKHPVSGQELSFSIDMPEEWVKYGF